MSEKPLSTMASASDFGSEDTGSTPVGAADFIEVQYTEIAVGWYLSHIIGLDWMHSKSDCWQVHLANGAYCVSATGETIEQAVEAANLKTQDPDSYSTRFVAAQGSFDDAEYGHKEYRKSAVSDLLSKLGMGKPKLIRRVPK